MVGKVKRVRQKLHQDAVKISTKQETSSFHPGNTTVFPLNINTKSDAQVKSSEKKPRDVKVFNFPKRVFAGTVIPPEALVQTLGVFEPSVRHPEEPTTEQPSASEEKKQQSKKEKIKERRERWLNKISAIKLAREKQAELTRRKATPVVGDMRILADALPELRSFIKAPAYKKENGVVKKKAEPTDFGQMKPAQKRKLLEMEMSRFSEAIKDSTFKANSLSVIGEHLKKRVKQEDEQS